jgi:glycosyltransferase involved in cell wall biosynthesis
MKISVVIPAWNEEQLLPACLESVRMAFAARPDLAPEVIVVDNNSTDGTAAIAEAAGARVVFEEQNQIARARNAGAAVATGEWLLFLDADSALSTGLAREILGAINAGDMVACGSTMHMRGLPWWARGLMRTWNGVSRLFKWAAGSLLVCRRDAFRTVGGFSHELYAAEEIDLSRRLKGWGRTRGLRFRILSRHPLESSPRKLQLYSRREIFSQLGRLLLHPFRSLQSRAALGLWYDGRR